MAVTCSGNGPPIGGSAGGIELLMMLLPSIAAIVAGSLVTQRQHALMPRLASVRAA